MVFPATVLPVHVEINPTGSSWVDITGDVRNDASISISRGQSSEGSQSQPSQCNIVLDNRTGNYTPGNPMGAYYPNFGQNTPLRVWVEKADSYLLLNADADLIGTPDGATLDIVGDIDVRIDATFDTWKVN